MQVPEITSSTDYLSASSLLSAFALLSSASDGTSRQRRAAPGRKNGDLSDGTEYSRSSCNIRQYSGKYLCFFSPIRSRSRFRYFSVPVFDFILFCTAALMPLTVIFYGTCTSFLSFFPANCHLAVKHLPLPVICLKKSSSADRTF